MLHAPDSENAAGGETEIEITDLDSPPKTGKVPGACASRTPSLRARLWMSMAMIAGIAVLAAAVLVSMSHLPKAARLTIPSFPMHYPVSLSVVDEVCYAASADGVVTALRVSDGLLLWHHAGGKSGEESATVVDGIIYLAPFDIAALTVTVEALRASDRVPLWSRSFHTDSPLPWQLVVVNWVVYVAALDDGSVDALRASNGSMLWRDPGRGQEPTSITVAQGVIYLASYTTGVNTIARITANDIIENRSEDPDAPRNCLISGTRTSWNTTVHSEPSENIPRLSPIFSPGTSAKNRPRSPLRA